MVACAATLASAQQQQHVFPAKGQSPERQAKDEAACHDWAVLQVGFDPSKVAPPAPPMVQAVPAPPPVEVAPQQGSGARGAARGAARNAAVASASGGDKVGEAAVAGAVVGAVRGRRQSERQAQAQANAQAQSTAQAQAAAESQAMQQHQAARADYDAKVADFTRARAACLQGKGYTVK
jgi:hypothetical protein